MATQHTPSRSGAHLSTAQIKQHLAVMLAGPAEAGAPLASADKDMPAAGTP
ncbi:hypothetical protein [Tomitella cavernea]|uniref:Uncharacterized protein n=1 Tax=Tomitella cavernea TaxID=1387982 RepID=A0ABP9D633_9ACTN|nr:hypothetical protein [Tomitella cavernea]